MTWLRALARWFFDHPSSRATRGDAPLFGMQYDVHTLVEKAELQRLHDRIDQLERDNRNDETAHRGAVLSLESMLLGRVRQAEKERDAADDTLAILLAEHIQRLKR